MTGGVLHFVVPGKLDQRTGGYLYDAHMVEELRRAGRSVRVHELEGSFPEGDERARQSLTTALAGVQDGGVVVVDGLAGGGLPDVLEREGARLRLVALVHHPLAEETGLSPEISGRFRASERATLAACRGVVVTSRFTAGRLGSYGVAARRVRVAVPGTAPAAAATGPEPGEPPRLLCVASLTPRKGHTVLLEALAGVADLAWSCVLAGSEALAPEHARTARARASELGLDGRVRFLGELDQDTLDGWYARSSLFVLASHYEGYGMALTEAIARALPVLSTTGGAIPYTVPAEAGVLVKPGDPVALARALRSLLSEDSTLLDTLRAGAMREAAGLPDWPEAAKGFAEAIEEAATGPSPRRRTSAR